MHTPAIAPDSGTTESADGFFAKPAILKITTYSDTTLWRRVKDGSFPAPVQISPGRVAWRRRDVANWIQTRGTRVAPRRA
jgi:prophage regulatory protein